MINIITRIITGINSRRRNAYYKIRGVKLDGYSWLQDIEIPRNHYEIQIRASCALDKGIILLCSGERKEDFKIIIGEETYINRNTFIDASEQIKIGRQCGIGPNCYITDHDHGLDPNLPPLSQSLISQPTIIADRVWIGANVTILKGVTIGDDAVIGAGSVVTKDIPARAIAVGVPAKVIRFKQSSND